METLYLRKLSRKTKCLQRKIFLVRIWPEKPYEVSEFRGSWCCRSWKWCMELKQGDCFKVYTWSSYISKCPLPLYMANSSLPSHLPFKAGQWDGKWRESADWRPLGAEEKGVRHKAEMALSEDLTFPSVFIDCDQPREHFRQHVRRFSRRGGRPSTKRPTETDISF